MKVLIRIMLSIGLLYVAWKNAHWSVALSITLIFVAGELAAYDIYRSE